MTKEEAIATFDSNGPGISGNLFGLPFSPDNASLVVIPVPWDVTVSYSAGTSAGPGAILKASSQVDLAIREIAEAWKLGIAMLPEHSNFYEENQRFRELALKHIQSLESGNKMDGSDPVLARINEVCENLNVYIKSLTRQWLDRGTMVALLGGDHSTPLGFLRTLAEKYSRFGILQFDAHADLRKSYEGFTYSHASIMYNAMKLPSISRLVQVGIRDFCDEELAMMQRGMGRIVTYFDQDIKSAFYEGKTWGTICDEIIQHLPEYVYISFDIDGLKPSLSPNTGTPVPGGLEFEQVIYCLQKLVRSGKRIIGFDLVEVAPGKNEWDANVAARLLYQMCNWMAVSQNKLKATALSGSVSASS